MSTCVAFKSALEVAGLELPDLDGAVLGGCGELGVLRVEGEACYSSLVAGHGVFGRGFG